MSKEIARMCESSNRVRVSPYPLRSSRTKKHNNAYESSHIETNWEEVQCVICMEPPHNAILLTCTSCLSGCRPYMCDTSVRHSNCFKQFRRNNQKKRLNPKTLHCPLCRGKVFETKKVAKAARRLMNAKPRSCTVDGCGFSGTYSHLDKHLKTEHRGLVIPKVDPQRQRRWEMIVRHAEYVDLMTAAEMPHTPVVLQQHLIHNHNPHVYQVTINGTVWNLIDPSQGRSGFGPLNNAAMQFQPLSM